MALLRDLEEAPCFAPVRAYLGDVHSWLAFLAPRLGRALDLADLNL